MSGVNQKTIISSSADETEELAKKIGEKIRGGEVIELTSDLGGGKTTFVRGLARGIGSKDLVTSPSFTVKNTYKVADKEKKIKEIWHFDFYRLNESGVVGHELEEAINDDSVVVVIEWAKDISKVLPGQRLTIDFTPQSDETRKITISYSKILEYLVEEL